MSALRLQLFVAFLFTWLGFSGSAAEVLLREVASREISLHVGGVQEFPVLEAQSHEVSIYIGADGPDIFPELVSRSVSLVNADNEFPAIVADLLATANPTGEIVTLDWSSYPEPAQEDLEYYDVYVSDQPFSDVGGMTRSYRVPAGTQTLLIEGLTAWTDHFFAVVPVDALGGFNSSVLYAATYVLGAEVVSREVSLFVGAEDVPSYPRPTSREVSLAVGTNAVPDPLTELGVEASPTGEIASLDWRSYPELAQEDVIRYDIYLSDQPFFDVTGMDPHSWVPVETRVAEISGLTAWEDHFFAVVPVDVLGQFNPQVIYAAAYVLAPEVVSREVSLFVGAPAPSPRQAVSREISALAPDDTVPAPVTGIDSGFTAETSTLAYQAVDLSWPNYDEITQVDVLEYRIYVSSEGFTDVSEMGVYETIGAGVEECTVGGLESRTIYYFAVVAVDVSGQFNPTVYAVSALTSIGGVSAVQNLAVESGATSLTYTWEPPAEGGDFLERYEIFFDGATDPEILPKTATTYVADGLEGAHGYSFRIVAMDIFGSDNGSSSIPTAATWLANPTLATRELDGEVRLSWEGPEPSGLVQEYALYQSDADFTDVSAMSPVATTTETMVTVSGLTNWQTYYFALVAVNVSAGFSPTVVAVSAVPQPDEQGAKVIASAPSGAGAFGGAVEQVLQSFTVVFDEIMDAGSFTPADVVVTDPDDQPVAVVAVNALSEVEFEVALADSVVAGTYLLTVGPGVLDESGNLMDQDGDGVEGEEEDAYEFTIDLSNPGLPVGSGDGLLAEYFEDADRRGTSHRRVDATIDFDWGGGSPFSPIPEDNFGVAWTGELEIRFSGDYVFRLVANDGARLWLNDELLLDGWSSSHGELLSAPVSLGKGRQTVRLEFVERSGDAEFAWSWSCPFFADETIPQSQLYSTVEFATFAATPTVSPAGGTVTSATDILLATTTANASIYYTFDDASPESLEDWTLFAGAAPIHLVEDARLRAFAVGDDCNRSGVLVSDFDVQQTELSGFVRGDPDADGQLVGDEPAIPNILVFLDADGDGRWTLGEISDRSNADGSYRLASPFGGTFRLRIALDDDYRLTVPGGQIPGYDVDTVPGQQVSDLDFGLVESIPPTADFNLVVANALPAFFTGTVDDPTATVQVLFHEQTLAATNAGDGTWSLPTAGFGEVPEGSYDVELVATDILGNQATFRIEDAVRLSSVSPAVTEVSPLEVEGSPLNRFEIRFNGELNPDSLQAGDFNLSQPGTRETLSASLFRLESGGSLAIVQFPDQVGNGDYLLTVGPDIENSFGNLMSGAFQQNIRLKLPDLRVVSVGVAPENLSANGEITVSWVEENLGLLAMGSGWQTDFHLLQPTRGAGDELFLGSVESTASLAAGAQVQRQQTLRLPDWIPAGADLKIRVESNPEGQILEADLGNNSALSQTLSSAETLRWELAASEVLENAGTLAAKIWRNGNADAALTVTLEANPGGTVSVPETVEIPAGAMSVDVVVTLTDDTRVDGNRQVTLSATAGALVAQSVLGVLEDDAVVLQLLAEETNVLEGDSLAVRLVRDDAAGLANALVVDVSFSDGTQLLVDSPVEIPAGSAEVAVVLRTIDDDDYEQIVSVVVTATAAGCTKAELTVEVFDDDEPDLTVVLERDSCSEGDGPQAISGVVGRGERAGADLRVKLEVDDPNSLSVPGEIVILAGQEEAAFQIAAIDNDELDGDREVKLTVSGLMSNCGCSAASRQARAESIVEVGITVRDDDAPGLALRVDKNVAQEGVEKAFTFTLSRNTDTGVGLEVVLSADPAGELSLPPTVNFAVGEAEISFFADSLDDGLPDGNTTVLVRAENATVSPAEIAVTVTDVQLPDLVVTAVSSDARVLSGNTFSMRFTFMNQGQAIAGSEDDTEKEGWTQRVYLSPDPYAGDDQLVGDYHFPGPMPVGEEWQVSQTVTDFAPPVNGEYWVVVVVDNGNDVDEILETNNVRISEEPVLVEAAYGATVSTDFQTGPAAATLADVVPIPLYGTAAYFADGAPAAYAPVHIHILLRDYERTLLAITNANGEFTTFFRPLPGEGGEYIIGACHPGDSEAPEQDSFILYGMRAEPAEGEISLPVGDTVNEQFTIHNLSEIPLSGLSVAVLDAPDYLHVNPSLGDTDLAGSGSLALGCEFTADDPGSLQNCEITLRVDSNEGAAVEIPVNLTVRPLKAVLVATPETVYAGAKRGEQTLVQVLVENRGATSSGSISIDLPTADWLTLGTETPLPSIAPGESRALVFCLTPAADAELVLYEGSFVLEQEYGDSLRVPFEFRVISDAVGDLEVTTVNQFYYYAEGAPTLPGATVQILDGFTGEEVAQAVSDESGVARFPNLPEGYYTVIGQAEQHRQHRGIVFVAAGTTNSHLAYMVRKTVEVSWTVEEVELEDRVNVIVETTFETNVPAPVVTVEPAVIDLGNLQTVGQIERINLTITNHGLISAADLRLNVGTHPFYSIEPLITRFGDLPAKGSITVPVVLRRIGDYSTVRSRSQVPCGIPVSIQFELCQGIEAQSVGTSNVDGDCGGGGGGVVFGGGGGGGISAAPFGVGGSICACILEGDCPCIIPYLNAGLGCIINFIPGADVPKCIYGTYGCLDSAFSGNVGMTSLTGCIGAALDCAAAVGRAVPGMGQLIGGLNCLSGINDAINECNSRERTSAAQLVYDNVQGLLRGAEGHYKYFLELYGDEKWFDYTSELRRNWEEDFLLAIDETSPAGARISAEEQTALLALSAGTAIGQDDKQKLIDRYNNSETYLQNGWVSAADVPAGYSQNFVDVTVLREQSQIMDIALALAQSIGYDDFFTAMKAELEKLNQMLEEGAYAADARSVRSSRAGGQCARVKLLLSQDVVLAHEGFEATLKIENSEDMVISELGAEVTIVDEEGNDSTDLLVVGDPELAYFTALDGTGVLTGGSTGTAQWLIVPRAEAAPETETKYYVGGTLSYMLAGNRVTIPLTAVEITVHPQPEIHLEYYHHRDVFSDDPWTEEVEPSQPYELAVLVRNSGAGEARNLRIISGQPQIVENEKGLLIDFQLIGHEIEGQAMSPSLTANFGDLPAGGSAIARWWMTSTLQGQFTEYKATLEHTSPLGDPRLSQVKDVTIFELIHSVEVDGEAAFLTNDVGDEDDFPDTIHQQDGGVLSVSPMAADESVIVTGTLAPGQLAVTLETPSVAGWNYLRLVDRDPGAGEYVLVDVRDENDASLPPDNFWQTDRTFTRGGVRPTLENNLHLLYASDATVRTQRTFTLIYRSADQIGPVVRDLSLPDTAVVSESQDVFLVTLSEAIDLASLTAADFLLEKNGVAVASLPALTTSFVSETQVRVAGFASANAEFASYRLSLSGSGVTDVFGNAGLGSASIEWTVCPDGPVPTEFQIVGNQRQNYPIDACEIRFSRDIDLATVGAEDFTLLFNGVEVALSAPVFTAIDSDGLQISGLAADAAIEGEYELTVDAATISGSTGIPGFGTARVVWVLDQTAPQVTDIIPVEPSLLTANGRARGGLEYILITFGEEVKEGSFSLAALQLSLDAAPLALPGTASLSTADNLQFKLSGIDETTAAEGNYSLTIALDGVRDEAGNFGSGNAVENWLCDNTPPAVPTNLQITPDTGESASDGITNASTLTFSGELAETGLTVRVRDSGAAAQDATVVGSSFSVDLDNLVGGSHTLLVVAQDASGNEVQAEWTIFVDTVDLDATLTPDTLGRSEVNQTLVEFSAAIDAATFTLDDLELYQDGTLVPLGRATLITALGGEDTNFVISDLPIPIDAGLCELRLDLTGVNKKSSGRNGSQTVSVSWQNQGALQNLDLAPRSPLRPETIVSPTRSPSLVGNTPFDWLEVVVEDELGEELARSEVIGGVIALPFELERDGSHTLTIRGKDAKGEETSRELEVVVDSRAPEVLLAQIERSSRGEVIALGIHFSEDMNLQAKIDDGSISTLVTLDNGLGDRRAAVVLSANEFTWDGNAFELRWTPVDPLVLNPGIYEVRYDLAGITDFAEHSLTAPDNSFTFVVARTEIINGSPTVLNALGPASLTYRWDFDDGSEVVEGQSVVHEFAANGDFEIWMTVFSDGQQCFRYITDLVLGTGNQAPNLDLDTETDGNDAVARFCVGEDNTPLLVLEHLLLSDSDDRALASVTVTLQNPVTGELEKLVAPATLPDSLTATLGADEHSLVLSGVASPEEYRVALAGVLYQNDVADPAAESRTILVEADDGKTQTQRSITLQTRDQMSFLINPGWQLFSLPFIPFQADAETVFGNDEQGSLIAGKPSTWATRHVRYVFIDEVPCQKGVWVFSTAVGSEQTRESVGFCQRNQPNFILGWNLWGPAEEISVDDFLAENPGVMILWQWLPGAQSYWRPAGTDKLQRGEAYWILFFPPRN